ncbi:MAG: hypothetical protein NC453_19360, partial [Muribaculum sp.]|nr:hypothetical protein [Muribaculum sp.]
FITYPWVSLSKKIMINFACSDATCWLKRGLMRRDTIAKHYCRVPFKKIRPDLSRTKRLMLTPFIYWCTLIIYRMDVRLSVYFHSINGFLGRNCPATALRQAH